MNPDKMRMWQAAEMLLVEIDRLLPRVRQHAMNSADHMERSGESVLYNIAEGAGAFRPKVKANAYEVAKREANELRAILRRLAIKGVLTPHDIRRAYSLAGAIVGMLTRAIITLSQRV